MTVYQVPDSREVTLIHDRQSNMIEGMLDQSSYPHAPCLSLEHRAPSWHMADNDDDNNDVGGDGDSDTGVVVRTKPKTKKPAMYKLSLIHI